MYFVFPSYTHLILWMLMVLLPVQSAFCVLWTYANSGALFPATSFSLPQVIYLGVFRVCQLCSRTSPHSAHVMSSGSWRLCWTLTPSLLSTSPSSASATCQAPKPSLPMTTPSAGAHVLRLLKHGSLEGLLQNFNNSKDCQGECLSLFCNCYFIIRWFLMSSDLTAFSKADLSISFPVSLSLGWSANPSDPGWCLQFSVLSHEGSLLRVQWYLSDSLSLWEFRT